MRTLALLALLALVPAGTAAAAAPSVTVTTSFSPAAIQYGDPVTAVVEVQFDPKRVDSSSISAVPSFTPFALVAKPVVENAGPGLVRLRYSLLCVTEGCLPIHASKVIRLSPFRVSTGAGTTTAAWVPLRIDTRLRPSDLRGEAPFRSPAAPPEARYGVDAGLFVAASAICALAALALVVLAVSRRRKRTSTRRVSPLELAIAYVRDAAGRPDQDRRRALELLSEAVHDDLAVDAADAAWSRRAPTPAGAGELADRAERRL